jgi:hypothetical protein
MNAKGLVFELITGAIVAAIIFTLVRPGSPAATAVADVSNALAALVKTTTNYTAGASNG